MSSQATSRVDERVAELDFENKPHDDPGVETETPPASEEAAPAIQERPAAGAAGTAGGQPVPGRGAAVRASAGGPAGAASDDRRARRGGLGGVEGRGARRGGPLRRRALPGPAGAGAPRGVRADPREPASGRRDDPGARA